MQSLEVEWAERIRSASAARTPLRLRGGGSKDFYGNVPQGELLDTRGWSGIVDYEPSELVVTVRAGTPLRLLEAELAKAGQCLPFEPPHYSVLPGTEATVGGMVASGLAGPARACVGGVRDYVLGAAMINGKGESLRFGGQVMKNVAGYDVSRVLAGSLGVLGLITEVSLKVLPQAPAEATLRFAMGLAQAVTQLNTWAGQPLPLNASTWLQQDGHETLTLRLRGARAAVDAACQRLLAEQAGEVVDAAQAADWWSACRDLRLSWFAQGFARGRDLWRLSLPATCAPLNLGDTLVEWMGAQRWVWATAGDPVAAQAIRAAALAAGGHATLFVAVNPEPIRITDRFSSQSAALMRIHQQLKAAFDPAGIFNPGRLYADL